MDVVMEEAVALLEVVEEVAEEMEEEEDGDPIKKGIIILTNIP